MGEALTEAAPREDVDAFADLPSLLAETRADGAIAVEDLRRKQQQRRTTAADHRQNPRSERVSE